MLECLGHRDHVHIYSFDRLAISIVDPYNLLDEIFVKGSTITFHKENLAFNKNNEVVCELLFEILNGIFQLEKALIRKKGV